jgi:hypothetical protein
LKNQYRRINLVFIKYTWSKKNVGLILIVQGGVFLLSL